MERFDENITCYLKIVPDGLTFLKSLFTLLSNYKY